MDPSVIMIPVLLEYPCLDIDAITDGISLNGTGNVMSMVVSVSLTTL